MIVVLKNNSNPEKVDNLVKWLESRNIRVHIFKGVFETVFGLIGDTSGIDIQLLEGLDVVKSVKRISEPFKNANRQFHPDDSVLNVSGVEVGGDFCVIAGPCSVESQEQIIDIAKKVKAAGATFLRGGAFKPRTSPYDFQGLQDVGISLLLEAKKQTGLPIVTEIMNANHIPMFEQVDIIQVGARNMQNFELLKELGRTNKTILLKRGLANTIKEFLMSAEYIMAGGNENIILCERGIRTFEQQTRNTLDISAVPVLKELSHLPVVVDPSHACGVARYVKPMSLAAAAAGAHGVMIEVHNDPTHALCDGAQSLTPEQFLDVKQAVDKVLSALRN
ncbi:MAG: 3-deoxy-7-phosphoheptulonate synthase [Firmicutes bacterium HGW-Firmicutes-21]|nr:MAG: 3-deoxy-7-phosphoheptulonate synthase [Firmicutes bacterium HGW-Firmicutes-21]